MFFTMSMEIVLYSSSLPTIKKEEKEKNSADPHQINGKKVYLRQHTHTPRVLSGIGKEPNRRSFGFAVCVRGASMAYTEEGNRNTERKRARIAENRTERIDLERK